MLPFYYFEWVWEGIAHALSNWALLEALEYAGRLSVLFGVVYYVYQGPARERQSHYQAWQVINTAQGKGGSGGRIDALESLNRDHVALVGVNAEGAFLMGVQLSGARLLRANLGTADLRNCRLDGANLGFANLSGANLREATLRRADFENGDLSDADLEAADFTGAKVAGASFARADLRGVNFSQVQNWAEISDIKLANVVHLRGAPAGFLDWALAHGAVSIESEQEWYKLTSAATQ